MDDLYAEISTETTLKSRGIQEAKGTQTLESSTLPKVSPSIPSEIRKNLRKIFGLSQSVDLETYSKASHS